MTERTERLCEQAKQGDLCAASELVDLFYAQIFAYFRRLTSNESDAGDLTQKTFFKVWLSLVSYQGRSSFKTWLHGIAHHVYVDWRRQADLSESASDAWWESCIAPGADPFEGAAERDAAHQLYCAVERLGEDARETVHLHYYQGLSLLETAEALGIAVSTVKYRLTGALASLRRLAREPNAVPPST